MGLGMTSFITSSTGNLQLTADAEKRGRVLALQSVVLIGSTPIGGPIVGAICQAWGARVGLLQNLNVVLAADGEHYEVVAGRRRLAALKLLVKRRKLGKDFEVPCLLVADAAARTVSLTENVQREAMHPADQFEAFSRLAQEGACS